MANIKQCDICKAVYPGLSWKDRFGITAVPETDTVRLDSVGLTPDNLVHYDKVTYDICPDCHSKILGFIEGLSKEDEKDG